MDEKKRIIILGESVVMAGIRASLNTKTDFEVITLKINDKLLSEMFDLQPCIVIFEVGSIDNRIPEVLIQHQNSIFMLGIDPENNQALLWQGTQLGSVSVDDLVEIIHTHA